MSSIYRKARVSLVGIAVISVFLMAATSSAESQSRYEGVPFGVRDIADLGEPILTTEEAKIARQNYLTWRMRRALARHKGDMQAVYDEMTSIPGFYNIAHRVSVYRHYSPNGALGILSSGTDVEQHIYISYDAWSGDYFLQGVTNWDGTADVDAMLDPEDVMAVSMQYGDEKGFIIRNNSWDCVIEDQHGTIYNDCWLQDSSATGGAWAFEDRWSGADHIGNLMAASFWLSEHGDFNYAKSQVHHNWGDGDLESVSLGWPDLITVTVSAGVDSWEKDSGSCRFEPPQTQHCEE